MFFGVFIALGSNPDLKYVTFSEAQVLQAFEPQEVGKRVIEAIRGIGWDQGRAVSCLCGVLGCMASK